MAHLKISSEVADDLRAIAQSGEISAESVVAKVAALLREAQDDPSLADRFIVHGDAASTVSNLDFNVDSYRMLQDQGIDAWRLKILDLTRVGLQYRIIYAWFPLAETIIVLAVIHRSVGYDDPGHPTTQRIIRRYESLRADGWE